MTAPKPLVRLAQASWDNNRQLTGADLAVAIRAEGYLVDLALRWVADMLLQTAVTRNVRTVALGGSTGHMSKHFLTAVTDRALSLLDVQFGDKALGDYTPVEARTYATWLLSAAQTQATRAHFVRAVADKCRVANEPIREQLSAKTVQQIRDVVLGVARKRGIKPDDLLGGVHT